MMRRLLWLTPILAIAYPLTAVGAPADLSEWPGGSYDKNTDWVITQLLSDDVIASQHTEVGEVYDVLLDADGTIQSILIYSNGNHAERGYYQVDWPVKSFEPTDPTLSIAMSVEQFQQLETAQTADSLIGENQYGARELLGMGVWVDELAYAEVGNLVVNDNEQVVSAIIDPDGLDTPDYWIPTDLGWISADRVIVVPYSQSAIEGVEPVSSAPTS